jgi:hypothetical protein
MRIPQRSEITRWRHHGCCAGSQSTMYSGCLRAVLERMDSRQLSLSTQRIGRVAMRITATDDRLIVPLDYTIEQTHESRVGDQRADFRFVDQDSFFHHLPVTPRRLEKTFIKGNEYNEVCNLGEVPLFFPSSTSVRLR